MVKDPHIKGNLHETEGKIPNISFDQQKDANKATYCSANFHQI